MTDTRRLVAKLDEALRIVQKQRRGQSHDAKTLADQLRSRFGAGRPFEIKIGAMTHTVRPDLVRISKSRIELGPADIPLMCVTDCVHDEQDGEPIRGPGIMNDDMNIVPIEVL